MAWRLIMLMSGNGVASISFTGGDPIFANSEGVIDVPVEFVFVAKEVFGMTEFIPAPKPGNVVIELKPEAAKRVKRV